MSHEVLIAGIGNTFLGDDAFGVEVVRRLMERPLPDDVRVIDFGIRSWDLAYALMEKWKLIVLVDALPQGGEPGTLYLFEPETAAPGEPPGFDAHAVSPDAVLQLVGAMGGRVNRLLLVGCEPCSVKPRADGNIRLSWPVRSAVDGAVRMIEGLVTRERSQAAAA